MEKIHLSSLKNNDILELFFREEDFFNTSKVELYILSKENNKLYWNYAFSYKSKKEVIKEVIKEVRTYIDQFNKLSIDNAIVINKKVEVEFLNKNVFKGDLIAIKLIRGGIANK